VFDRDWPDSDDEIGTVSIPAPHTEEDIRSAPSFADLTAAGAYRLHFEVYRI
jgi:hypothetical protein